MCFDTRDVFVAVLFAMTEVWNFCFIVSRCASEVVLCERDLDRF